MTAAVTQETSAHVSQCQLCAISAHPLEPTLAVLAFTLFVKLQVPLHHCVVLLVRLQ